MDNSSPEAKQQQQQFGRVDAKELLAFVDRCMRAAGCPAEHAAVVAEVLVAADLRGVHSHGVNRLEMYVGEIKKGEVDPLVRPTIVNETPAVACVDGQNGLGMVIGRYCMDVAIKKAKEMGIGWVVTRGSNHYGIAGYYAMMALQEGMVGMSYTNTSPISFPTRSSRHVLGTNPIAVAAPSSEPSDPFVLDMATTTVALGKVEIRDREGRQCPPGWGADKAGHPTTDPKEILNGGGLLYLGGEEDTGGYKGFGLAMMVELFAGILSGADYAAKIPPWRQGRGRAANLGQCFVAINPNHFCGGFNDRMGDLMQQMRDLPPVDPALPVLVPGDPEKTIEAAYTKEGIAFHLNLINALQHLASELNVAPLLVKS